jgi:hypothetical protein
MTEPTGFDPNDPNDPQYPFWSWLLDRTQPIPTPPHRDVGQMWLNPEPDDTVTVWCWPCTTGPEDWIARIPDNLHNPDYNEQAADAVHEHMHTAHADQKVFDA